MLISIRSSFGACIIIWGRLCRGSLRSQFFLMRLYEIRHRVEAEIIGRKLARHHRRAEPFLRVATIDPAIGETVAPGGHVIVEQAFGGMKHVLGLEAEVRQLRPTGSATCRERVGQYV